MTHLNLFSLDIMQMIVEIHAILHLSDTRQELSIISIVSKNEPLNLRRTDATN